MTLIRWTWALGLLGAVATAAAQSTPAPDAAPDARELDQRVRILERKLELADEAATEKAKKTPVAIAGAEGFGVKSPDGAFQLRLRGLVQTDARYFLGDDERPLTDTLVVRRARPILDGTLWKLVDFRLMSDFGGGGSTLLDAYLDLKLSSALRIRIGKAKVPVGLEALLEDAHLPFVERGLPSLLAPVRDVGIQVGGEPLGGRLVYAAGLFNGVADGASGDGDNADDKDFALRVFLRPFQRPAGEPAAAVSLGFGVAASLGDQSGTAAAPNLPSFRTVGQQTFFAYRGDGSAGGTVVADGERIRIAPQAWLYAGPWLVLAEWTESRQEVRRDAARAELAQRAWQVAGSWAITGEDVTERSVAPRRPFEPGAGGGRGALLLSVRYGRLESDPDAFPIFADPARSAARVENLGASLGWLLNRGLKLVLDYQQTRFEGGERAGDRETEQAVLARVQLAF